MIIKGYNSFYDGWLAWLLGVPYSKRKNSTWQLGYRTGAETGENAALALRSEILLGHVIVDSAPKRKGMGK